MHHLKYRYFTVTFCLMLLTPYSFAETASSFDMYLMEAQNQASQNHPEQALFQFQQALAIATQSNNQVQIRIANFGIARAQMWLGKYGEAENSYRKLYQENLSNEDKEIALDGLLRSLNYQDKSQAAIAYIPNTIQLHNISLIISIAQTYVALGNIDKAREILKQHESSLQEIVKDSRLSEQLMRINKAISANQAEPAIGVNPPTDILSEVTRQARDELEKNNGKKAFNLIQPYIETNKRFELYIIAAKAMAMMENPGRSLSYYKKSLPLCKSVADKKVVLFGVAKMQLWLNELQEANKVLNQINRLPLNKTEKRDFYQLRTKVQVQIRSNAENDNIARISRYIQANDGVRSFALINQLYKNEYNFTRYRLSAESMVLMNKPNKALYFYQKSLLVSKTKSEQIAALFGIAKMHFWIANYVRAERTYRMLLTYQLSPSEYQVALSGLVKSLAYYDRPRSGYKSIPANLIFTHPQLVISAGQAALWSDWADITKCILDSYKDQTHTIDLNSTLGSDYLDLVWQTNLATSANVVTPSYFASHDSENFDKRDSKINFSHYWNQISRTEIGFENINYTQNSPFQMKGNGFYIGEILRPTRKLLMKAYLQPFHFKNDTTGQRNNWNPVLWDFNANYFFNDYVFARIQAKREIVETFPAFNNELTDNLYSAGLVINPVPYVHLDGSLFQLAFKDNNRRQGYFSSASVLFAPDFGLTLTGILRGYGNNFSSPDYFSPRRYMAETLLLKLGRKLGATWHYYIDGGSGKQFISAFGSPTVSSPTYQWGAGINGPITNHFIFTAYYANTHQASGFINSPDYDYKYGEVSLNIIL